MARAGEGADAEIIMDFFQHTLVLINLICKYHTVMK